MKKTVKMLSVILLVTLIAMFSFGVISNATDGVVGNLFNSNGTNTAGIQNVGANIVSIITTIGIIVGIKYMMGSASEKAEYKKTMIPYLIGAVLIFGASAIAKAVIAMSESITAGG